MLLVKVDLDHNVIITLSLHQNAKLNQKHCGLHNQQTCIYIYVYIYSKPLSITRVTQSVGSPFRSGPLILGPARRSVVNSPPADSGRARPPNGLWCILSFKNSAFSNSKFAYTFNKTPPLFLLCASCAHEI